MENAITPTSGPGLVDWISGHAEAEAVAKVIRAGDAPSCFLVERVADCLGSPIRLHGLLTGLQRIISTSLQVDQWGCA